MSKKNTKNRKKSIYPRYSFNINHAISYNNDCYERWLYMDEGQERPDPMRLTYFLFKYCKINKKTGKSIMSYIPKENVNLICSWIRMTKAERKRVRELVPDAGRKVTHWIHQAEMMQWNAIDALKNK